MLGSLLVLFPFLYLVVAIVITIYVFMIQCSENLYGDTTFLRMVRNSLLIGILWFFAVPYILFKK